MDKTRAKIKSTSMTAFVAILAIALLFGIQTSINIFDWLTTGEALSNPDSVRHGMGLLGDGLLVALAVYVALVFLRINREETPFFANLPRKIKAVAVLLFATLAVPKWLYWAADRKVSLGELAEKVGIADGNLSKLKNGKVSGVRFKTLNAICKELDCQPGDLLEFVDDEEG